VRDFERGGDRILPFYLNLNLAECSIEERAILYYDVESRILLIGAACGEYFYGR